uniref:Uncharacterized protein n=1 Tax=Tanacetum cinerariifolium TaxID=118510 RepID=A0A6L2L0P0_TANCI|nr:hypothetical protein [Tanacetum cinerariifolium]
MAALVITISSDVSEESVGFIVLRVTIPIKIPIAPVMPTDPPTTPELPAVSPFLCSDDFESEPADELHARHVSLRPYDDVLFSWRDRVRFRPSLPSGYSSPDTTIPSGEIPFIPTPPAPSTGITTASPACMSTPGIIASLAVRSHESSDESSPKTHIESYMDSNIRSNIEAETAATAMKAIAIVVESESESEEAEADEEADAKVQPEGTIEIEVDVTTGIDIPHDLPTPDAMEQLGQLEEGMQIEHEGKNLIAEGESSSLLGHVMALEDSNTRLQDGLVITITHFGMTPEAIKELISRRVEEALAAQEANRNAGLIDENQSQNGDDNNNESRGNGNHRNNIGDGN